MLEDILRSPRRLYYALPGWQKRIVGGAYRSLPMTWRLGEAHRRYNRIIRETEYASEQSLENYQIDAVKKTLAHAYAHVPYYRKRFSEYGVGPADFQSLDDIRKFPFLTKKDIQDNYDLLIADDVPPWRRLVTTTGGSTAEPLKFLQVRGVTRSKERAFIWDGWARMGYQPGMRTIQLKGRSVGNPNRGIFWEYEPIQNYLEMDGNFLSADNLPRYLEAIRSFRPEFLIGYVSSVFLLARHLVENKEEAPPRLKAIFLASENIYPGQRESIEAAFQCRTFSHYGHSEMVLLGMECERSHDLHFYPQYGFLEVLDSDGRTMQGAGTTGELVGTSVDNDAMPLIRYRTQDYGTLGLDKCPCGRHYPILRRVEGRLQEFIVTGDRHLISICVMGAAHFEFAESVSATQYYQEKPGAVVFRVVPRPTYSGVIRQRIRDALREKLGPVTEVEIQEVPFIKRSPSGKHVMMEQKISADVLAKCGYPFGAGNQVGNTAVE